MKLAVYTRYWTSLTWFTLIVLSVGLYTLYIWVANLIDIFVIYQTIQEVFKTPQFYLVVALNVGCVFLFEAMFVYVQKEYFTQASDYLRVLSKKGQINNEQKLEKIENLMARKKKKQPKSIHYTFT